MAAGDDASSAARGSILKSVFSSFTWGSPHLSSCSAASSYASSAREEEWKLAATQLSYKLLQAIRKRDEALSEASRLKHSVSELEKKLTRLENYSRDLKSTLEQHHRHRLPVAGPAASKEFPLKAFLRAVSDSRAAVRLLSRSLSAQISQPGNRSAGGAYLEALLSRAFYGDFESAGFKRGGAARVLDPSRRAEANMAAYEALREVSWEDVLSRGTKHYSEGFSRFCDAKMGEVGGALLGGGGSGSWPEPLLRAFFGAAKGVWLVHLLAWCSHPPVPILRVEKGEFFDDEYMEALGEDGAAGRRTAATVRMMVAPGFYVRDGAVKCQVICSSAGERRKIVGAGAGAGAVIRKSEEETVDRTRRR